MALFSLRTRMRTADPKMRYGENNENCTLKSVNYQENNNKYKTQYEVDHEIFDRKCSILKLQLIKLQARTNYKVVDSQSRN